MHVQASIGETALMLPVAPYAPPKPKGTAGLWVGAAIIIIGIVGGALLAIAGVRSIIDTVNSYQRVSISGGTVRVDDPGTYRVFIERPGVDSGSGFYFQPRVSIVAPNGRASSLVPDTSTQTYSWDGHDGRSLGRFEADEAGRYRIITESGATSGAAVLAVGKGNPFGGLAAVGGGVIGGIIVFIVGVIVMIVSGVRRSRSKRELAGGYAGTPLGGWAPPPLMGAAGPGGPGAHPPAGPTNGPPGSAWATGGGAMVAPGWAPPPPAPASSPPPAPSPTPAASATGTGWAAPPPPGPPSGSPWETTPGPSWVPPPAGPSWSPSEPPPLAGPPPSGWPPPPAPWPTPEDPASGPERDAPGDADGPRR